MSGLDEFGENLRRRRTINEFESRSVPPELLRDSVDVARWAPNHRLTEPWHFYLLGPAATRAIVDLMVELKTAGKPGASPDTFRKRFSGIPGWFAVTNMRSPDPVREQEDYAACCCAIQNMSLYLWRAGIGIKWTTGGVIHDPRLLQILDVPADRESVVGLFHYGYPANVPEQRRRPVAEILTQLA